MTNEMGVGLVKVGGQVQNLNCQEYFNTLASLLVTGTENEQQYDMQSREDWRSSAKYDLPGILNDNCIIKCESKCDNEQKLKTGF